MQDPLTAFLAGYDPAIRDLVLQARALILAALPGALEQVDAPSRIIAYGLGPGYAGQVFALAPFKAHVNLMFARGASLADPAGLLLGTGKRARHARIAAPEDLSAPALHELLQRAANEARPR